MVPKVFFALAGAVAVNVVLIFVTVLGREIGDDDVTKPAPHQQTQSETGPPAASSNAVPDVGNGLPDVPSLPSDLPSAFSSLEALELADPAFMDAATELYPELKQQRGAHHAPTVEYFSALGQRLATVRQLTVASERLSRDAMRAADSDPKLAGRYLQMITQLREMASDLLVEEL